MYVVMTVGDIVALDVVQRGAPEVLSDSRWQDPVRWVHIGDVADLSTLLQGGELVLTTGLGLGQSPHGYLQGMADAGALGVVVELGVTMPSVPQSAVTSARRLGLALVVLHREIKFIDVTETVHRSIVAAQYDEVAFDRHVHATFTELSLQRASVTGIVEAASRILGEPVVLEDLTHQALSATLGADIPDIVLDDWERRSRLHPTAGGGQEGWETTLVGPRGQEWGRLIIPHAPGDRLRARMVLERAAAALALNRMIERDRTGLQHQAHSGLIDDVLQHRLTSGRDIAARAHALGLRKAARYHPFVVRLSQSAHSVNPLDAQRRNADIQEAVAHCVNGSGHTGLFSIRRDDEVGGLVALSPARATATALSELGKRLQAALRRHSQDGRSVLAVAEPAAEVVDAVLALEHAAHIAEVAFAMPGQSQPFYRASDVRLRGLLALLGDDERVQHFAEAELRPLLGSDSDTQLDLLRAYLAVGGNKASLAATLHLSRPALYKRLAVLGELLGVDLNDPESMTSLHVAVLILDSRRRTRGAVRGTR